MNGDIADTNTFDMNKMFELWPSSSPTKSSKTFKRPAVATASVMKRKRGVPAMSDDDSDNHGAEDATDCFTAALVVAPDNTAHALGTKCKKAIERVSTKLKVIKQTIRTNKLAKPTITRMGELITTFSTHTKAFVKLLGKTGDDASITNEVENAQPSIAEAMKLIKVGKSMVVK